MAETEEFAHGNYGDYSGVIFYGPPTNGFWFDRIAVSYCYIGPLFRGILDRAWQETGGDGVSRLASEWNTFEGWAAVGAGRVIVQPADAAQFVEALTRLRPADITKHCAGCTVEDCLRCAAAIREFITDRQAQGSPVFIEDD